MVCSFKNVVDRFQWALTRVYDTNMDRTRSLLWNELVGLSNVWDIPRCIDGDFNVTRLPSEKSGGSSFNSAMVDFSTFIYYQDILDIPLVGGPFDWSSN